MKFPRRCLCMDYPTAVFKNQEEIIEMKNRQNNNINNNININLRNNVFQYNEHITLQILKEI